MVLVGVMGGVEAVIGKSCGAKSVGSCSGRLYLGGR